MIKTLKKWLFRVTAILAVIAAFVTLFFWEFSAHPITGAAILITLAIFYWEDSNR